MWLYLGIAVAVLLFVVVLGVVLITNELRLAETYGDEEIIRLCKTDDVEGVRALLARCGEDWAQRHFYVSALSRPFSVEALEQWALREPESADAKLLLGARLLKQAWAIRGYGRGEGISEERWASFFAEIDKAAEVLEQSAELNPQDPTPWAYLIVTALYRNWPLEDRRYYFDEAISRDANNWAAHIHYLTAVSEKYQGSHAQMFEFARQAAEAPGASGKLAALVLKAHSEYWKYLWMFEGKTADAEQYAARPDVQQESAATWQRVSSSMGERTAGRAPLTGDDFFIYVNAAGWFWALREKTLLRACLDALGSRLRRDHWTWVGISRLRAARRFAGRA